MIVSMAKITNKIKKKKSKLWKVSFDTAKNHVNACVDLVCNVPKLSFMIHLFFLC